MIEASRLSLIVTLLGLDGVAPLYEEMGLAVPDKERFVQIMRRHFAEYLSAAWGNPAPVDLLVRHLLQDIEDAFGQQVAEHFYKWATTVFYTVHWDQPQWSAWEIILTSVVREKPPELNVPPEKYQLLAHVLDANSVAAAEQQIALLRSRPLSEWDAGVYTTNQFSNVEDPMCEDEFIDPYVFVLGTVEMNYFQAHWEELIKQLSESEKTGLWEYGKRLLIEEEVPMPDELTHPNQLHRQIHDLHEGRQSQ